MKRILTGLLALCLLCQGIPAALAAGREKRPAVEVAAKSALLMERETGTILYRQREHERLAPASVTKVMTMLLVIEAVDAGRISLDDPVTCSARAASMGGSQVYLKEGERMSVRDLLKAVAVASGNDAAVALAEHLAGSEPAFVERMNSRAGELGMEDTRFRNCNGLPEKGHVTSAHDIAVMSRELLSHKSIREYVGTWMDTLRDGEFQLSNTNKLIYYYEGATGLKTGFTADAGFCISASALRDGMELIAVVLGGETSKARFDDAKALLDYGFGTYTLTDVTPEKKIPPVAVRMGERETVPVEPGRAGKLLLKKEEKGRVRTRVELPESVRAPVRKGDALGRLRVTVDGREVRGVPLVAGGDVPRMTFQGIFGSLLRRMATGK